MAVMGSRVFSGLVCVLCVILLPAVWAENCYSYKDNLSRFYPAQNCYQFTCCGTCNNRQCCRDRTVQLNQASCSRGSYNTNTNTNTNYNDKKSKLGTLLGSILGSIFPILICVGVAICCLAPCCLCYKKCRKGRNQGTTANVINIPSHPHNPGYQPSNPGYHSVPGQPDFGGLPFPTAPPAYMGGGTPHQPAGGFGPDAIPMRPVPRDPYGQPSYPGDPNQPPAAFGPDAIPMRPIPRQPY